MKITKIPSNQQHLGIKNVEATIGVQKWPYGRLTRAKAPSTARG